jgi:hypothetical protein
VAGTSGLDAGLRSCLFGESHYLMPFFQSHLAATECRSFLTPATPV